MKREIGFYWVRIGIEWEVCQWAGSFWICPGLDVEAMPSDDAFASIDERKIINPNE
jgi:hypothetical protein